MEEKKIRDANQIAAMIMSQWVGLIFEGFDPSSIYSYSIGHILEQEFFCLGRLGSQGSQEKKWI